MILQQYVEKSQYAAPKSEVGQVEGLRNTAAIMAGQRGMLFCFFVYALLIVLRQLEWPEDVAFLLYIPAALVQLGVVIALSVYVYRLTRALGALPVPWILGVWVPLVNLFLVLVLSARASNALREAGADVGFWGEKTKPKNTESP